MRADIKERTDQIRDGKIPEGYKMSKLGIVPVEWKKIKFRDLFEEKIERTSDTVKCPLYSLTIEDGVVKKSERYDREHLVKKEDGVYKVVHPDEFVYNPMNIRFGAVARNKTKKTVCVSGYYDVFKVNNSNDKEFLESFLIAEQMIKYYNRVCTGSLEEKKRVHFSDFIMFDLPMPSSFERGQMSQIFTIFDKQIDLLSKLVSEYEKERRWLLQNLITGIKKVPGYDNNWIKVSLGRYIKESKVVAVPDIQKRLTVKLFVRGIEKRNTKNKEKEDVTTQYIRKAGQLIYGKQNLHNGAIAVVSSEFDGFQSSSDLPAFDVKSGMDVYWLYYYLSRQSFYQNLEKLATGTGSKRIKPEELYKIRVNMPCNIEEQRAIVKIIQSSEYRIKLLTQKLDLVKKQKKSMMQLLLSGIVRVNEI